MTRETECNWRCVDSVFAAPHSPVVFVHSNTMKPEGRPKTKATQRMPKASPSPATANNRKARKLQGIKDRGPTKKEIPVLAAQPSKSTRKASERSAGLVPGKGRYRAPEGHPLRVFEELFWGIATELHKQNKVKFGTMMGFPAIRTNGDAFLALLEHNRRTLILKTTEKHVDELVSVGGVPFSPKNTTPFKGWVEVPFNGTPKNTQKLWEAALKKAIPV